MANVILKYKDEEIGTWEIGETPLIAGRDKDSKIFIESPAISGKHCRIEKKGEEYIVTDLGSDTGTSVNGKNIQQAVLHNNDTITIGTYTLIFMDDSDQDPFKEDGGLDVTMMKDMKDELSKWADKEWSLHLKGKESEQIIKLKESNYILGSLPDCDIILKGWGISNNHAVFLKDEFGLRVVNVSNKKEILVNNKPAALRATLSLDDVVTIGSYEITIFLE